MSKAVKTLTRSSPKRIWVLATILLGLWAAPAYAQQRQLCAPRQAILDKFAAEFGEVPFGGGVDGAGQLIEILTSPSGSWTMLIVRPDKTACIMGSGDGWLEYPPSVPGRGA